jgi:3-isopropylmalate/(R)-2-methylmalate dehydratase small subunit
LASLFDCVNKDAKAMVKVDLEAKTITNLVTGATENFEINSYKRNCLLNGYDDIDFLLSLKGEIDTFEKNRKN